MRWRDFGKLNAAESKFTASELRELYELGERDGREPLLSRFGGKAVNLAKLKVNGFPVPEGVAISINAFAYFQKTGQINPELVEELEKIRQKLGGKVAIRSSAPGEDSHDLSMAGVFETHYLRESEQSIAEALTAIFEQAQSDQVNNYLQLHHPDQTTTQMAIVMQKLVEPEVAGVIYTDVNGQDILIQSTQGFGNRLVDGETEGSSVIFSPTTGHVVQSKNSDLSNLSSQQLEQLTQLASQIKTVFGGLPQDIEFATSAEQIHILQARTLTTELGEVDLSMSREDVVNHTKDKLLQLIADEKTELGLESVIFSDSNFSELLPRAKEMDFGVFSYIFTGSDGVPGAIQLGRRAMGYPLGDESVGYMHFVGGKPYFSIARDAHTFYAGFPDTPETYGQTLINEYLAQIDADPAKGEYPEMGLYLQDPSLEDLINRFGEQAGQKYFARYQQFKAQMAEHADQFLDEYLGQGEPANDQFILTLSKRDLEKMSPAELVATGEEILEHLRTTSCVHFVKAARLGFYYSQRLRQQLKVNFKFDDESVDHYFAKLNQGLDGSAITDANLAIAKSSSFEEALAIGQQKVGHYSTGEMLEIRHPRLKNDHNALVQYVSGIFSAKDQYQSQFAGQQAERLQVEQELLGQLESDEDRANFAQILKSAQTYMSLRETVKYQFVKEYDLLRDVLSQLVVRLNIDEEDIFSLYPRELASFISKPDNFKALIKERQERFIKYPPLKLPSVIRESDLDLIGKESAETQQLELLGKLLAQGQALAEAIIVNLEDFATVEAAREVLLFYRQQAIPIVLVASQMNLSHDPLIVQADGLVIENAGLVSHGAQRARELGRGALGGISASSLKTGEKVSFDPGQKIVKRLMD